MEAQRSLDLPLQELVYAGLEALAAVAELDVCAYLHHSVETGPQLFLGQPALTATKGPKPFGVFADLSAALERSHGDPVAAGAAVVADATVAGVACVTVATVGSEGRGVHAFGRRSELPPSTRAALVRLATALGTATHRLQRAGSAVGPGHVLR